mmetsp:Transcript_28470/g.88560  ORF Transcript_28470/g.88560 Transcript_28470/m.88560 type:complete len:362 (+) Transcript_28470:83-1168(+)
MGNVCTNNDKKQEAVEKVAMEPEKEAPRQKKGDGKAQGEPKLLISVVGARGLRESDWMPGSGKPDCYCEVKTGNLLLHTTRVIDNACEPLWAEECKVSDLADGSPLEFHVHDKDAVGSDFLGSATLSAKEYMREGFNGEIKLDKSGASQAYIRLKVKLAGKDLPTGPTPEITVSAEKPSKETSFGLDLDTQDGVTLHVLEVKGGPFQDYNSNAPADLQVKPGDVIVNVNGSTGSTEKMLTEFRNELKVECVIKRSVMTSIVFDRGDASTPLGLEFPEKLLGELLVVRSIRGGAAEAYNATAKDVDKLYPGDRIVSAGSVTGKAGSLKDKLDSQDGKIQLQILRAASQSHFGGGGLLHWFFG